MSGRAARMRSIEAEIVGARVAAVHRREDAVRARLHRQMQIGHQRVEIAMGGDQVVVHVARMAGGVAQPVEAGDLGEAEEEPAEAPGAAVRALAVPGIDVLAEQRDLADALAGEARRLGDDRRDRPRDFGAARVGHDAEGAELVAAFLHGEEGGDAVAAPSARRGRQRGRARRTSRRRRNRSRRRGRPRRASREQLGQAVIGLRADDQIDDRARGG